MTEFLKKINLIHVFNFKLDVTKNKFISELSKVTENSDLGIFSTFFEAFESSNKEFKGKVTTTGFKIRRKLKLFDTNRTSAIAEGIFTEKDNQLIIEGTISGFQKFFYFFYGFLAIFYSIFILVFIFNDDFPLFGLAFIILHGLAMCLIPYFIMRRSVNRLKYELEREFFYLTK
jgi:hypothetical protein